MGNDSDKSVCVGYAYLVCTILDVRLAVVVVAEIYFFWIKFIQKCSDCQFLFSSGLTSEDFKFFEFVVGDR
jgi:hypothetical protein